MPTDIHVVVKLHATVAPMKSDDGNEDVQKLEVEAVGPHAAILPPRRKLVEIPAADFVRVPSSKFQMAAPIDTIRSSEGVFGSLLPRQATL